jgi:hypothetical protein
MSILNNNKGIALVTALMFTLISLGITMALLYMVLQGTKMSAANKNYKTSLEASFGAVEVITTDFLPKLFNNYTTTTAISTFAGNYSNIDMALPSLNCFAEKTKKPTSQWDATLCSNDNKAASPLVSPDISMILKASNDPTGYKIFTKITDTKCGGDPSADELCSNSDVSGVDFLDSGGGVTGAGGKVTPQHKPAYYKIEVQGERASNPREKAQLSVLYAY